MSNTVIFLNDSMSDIQKKLNNGSNIKFSKGVYRITKQLIIPSNTVIDLNNSTLKRCGNIQSIFLNKVSKNTVKYKGAGNIIIKNGIFEGMSGYSYDNIITLFHSHDVEIFNCTIKDVLCHGIEINSSKNIYIHDCKFLGYNLESEDKSYREIIQIDYAGAGAFFINGSNKDSKCYDGTMCNYINIINNKFSKSSYRGYPLTCIGTHTQVYNSEKLHNNITISGNKFKTKSGSNRYCLSLIGMKNVLINDNTFNCSKIARIISLSSSYKLSGIKVKCAIGDGCCKKITIKKNKITGYDSGKEYFYINSKSNLEHKNIIIKNNK